MLFRFLESVAAYLLADLQVMALSEAEALRIFLSLSV